MEVIPSEVRDRDSGKKAKAKVYVDKKRNAKESDIGPGDKVLVNKNGRTICLHHLHLNRIKLLPKRARVLLLNHPWCSTKAEQYPCEKVRGEDSRAGREDHATCRP